MDSTLLHLECSSCRQLLPAAQVWKVCPACGRPLLARYDLDAAARTFNRAALQGRVSSLWRYAELLPVLDARHRVSLGEGWTPLLHLPRLGARLGLHHLYVKEEGRNPTGTFKARGLCLAVARARELGIDAIALPTAGNAGAAAAAYAARAGLRCHVAMPADAPPSVIGEVLAYGAELELVPGLIHDAGRRIAELCKESGYFDVATLKEPYRVEGKKTMGFELWEQFDGSLPEVVLYPTGGGTGLIGMWKAFAELAEMGKIDGRRPRMIAVQAAGCAPVVRAYQAGERRCRPWEDAATLAPGIRVPNPFADDLILEAVYQSGGSAIAVDDAAILAAMHLASRLEGVDMAPEGAATLAALELMRVRGEIGADERVVLFDCGTGLKHPELRPVAGVDALSDGAGDAADPAQVEQLAAAMERLGRGSLVVVTGAGISLASGIPTFRGSDPGAVWTNDVTELGTYRFFRQNPVESWLWSHRVFGSVADAKPNPAHLALARLEELRLAAGGKFLTITQNIDTLHEQAGSHQLVKVHGSADRYRCASPLGCVHGAPDGTLPATGVELAAFFAAPSLATLPRCPVCGDLLRRHVLWFDEYYNEHADYQWERVQDAAQTMQLLIFVGTSFAVGVTELFLQAALYSHVPTFTIDPAGQKPHHRVESLAARAEILLPAVVERLARHG